MGARRRSADAADDSANDFDTDDTLSSTPREERQSGTLPPGWERRTTPIGRDAICDAVRGGVGATCFPLTEASRCTEKVVRRCVSLALLSVGSVTLLVRKPFFFVQLSGMFAATSEWVPPHALHAAFARRYCCFCCVVVFALRKDANFTRYFDPFLLRFLLYFPRKDEVATA